MSIDGIRGRRPVATTETESATPAQPAQQTPSQAPGPSASDAFRTVARPGSAPPSQDEQLSRALEIRSARSEAATQATAPTAHKTLIQGSRGPEVIELQQKLEAAGFSPGTPDGVFGSKTAAAVRSFQTAHGLKPDAIVGPLTWDALDKLDAPPGPAPDPAPPIPVTSIPPRQAGAVTGSQFLDWTRTMSRPEREQAILQEILSGNVPDFLRNFKEIQLSARGKDGQMHTGTVRVLPDYLAIGSNDDFVRIPMGGPTGQRIAEAFGCSLPTRKLVDEVWKAADVRLQPIPLPPTAQMMSNQYTATHHKKIEQERAGHALGELTAGTKKDVVLTNRYESSPGQVAIYGWHQLNGKPIQPLNLSHESSYADYSHGIRLVAGNMIVDGVERPVADVLKDPVLSALLSDEGPIRNPRVPG